MNIIHISYCFALINNVGIIVICNSDYFLGLTPRYSWVRVYEQFQPSDHNANVVQKDFYQFTYLLVKCEMLVLSPITSHGTRRRVPRGLIL